MHTIFFCMYITLILRTMATVNDLGYVTLSTTATAAGDSVISGTCADENISIGAFVGVPPNPDAVSGSDPVFAPIAAYPDGSLFSDLDAGQGVRMKPLSTNYAVAYTESATEFKIKLLNIASYGEPFTQAQAAITITKAAYDNVLRIHNGRVIWAHMATNAATTLTVYDETDGELVARSNVTYTWDAIASETGFKLIPVGGNRYLLSQPYGYDFPELVYLDITDDAIVMSDETKASTFVEKSLAGAFAISDTELAVFGTSGYIDTYTMDATITAGTSTLSNRVTRQNTQITGATKHRWFMDRTNSRLGLIAATGSSTSHLFYEFDASSAASLANAPTTLSVNWKDSVELSSSYDHEVNYVHGTESMITNHNSSLGYFSLRVTMNGAGELPTQSLLEFNVVYPIPGVATDVIIFNGSTFCTRGKWNSAGTQISTGSVATIPIGVVTSNTSGNVSISLLGPAVEIDSTGSLEHGSRYYLDRSDVALTTLNGDDSTELGVAVNSYKIVRIN